MDSFWYSWVDRTALAALTPLGGLLLSAGAGGFVLAQGGGDRVVGRPFASRSPVFVQHGIAATSHPLASQIAVDVLKQGGSAVDAAIAANAALALMEPTGCGIGGDLFAMVWDPQARRLYGLNASGPSPQGLSYKQMLEETGPGGAIPARGPLPVSVPGAVDGWFKLHGRFGRLPMPKVLQPAVEYARNGFPVTQVIAAELAANLIALHESRSQITEFENLQKLFLTDGRTPLPGEVFRNPDLARTLETIGSQGRDVFYRGHFAGVMDAYARRVGLFLRKSDLTAFESRWVDPVSVSYRGHEVYELPPNGQGLAALQMLNILSGFDLAAMGHNSADYLHVQIEAKKLAFEDRARFYADPDFYTAPLARLLSPDRAQRQRAMISPDRANRRSYLNDGKLEEGDTIYLTVADSSGMMVSLIQSNYMGLGSGLVPDGLGFVFQNRGALFSLDPDHPNAYAPGKRPFHTIIPGFVMKDGRPFLSFGVMGGAMQPQGHVQVLCNIIDFGMNVQEAGDAARYRHLGSSQPTGEQTVDGGQVALETEISESIRNALAGRGHRVVHAPGQFGGYQAILWDPVNRVYQGASEMRKDGQVVGY